MNYSEHFTTVRMKSNIDFRSRGVDFHFCFIKPILDLLLVHLQDIHLIKQCSNGYTWEMIGMVMVDCS